MTETMRETTTDTDVAPVTVRLDALGNEHDDQYREVVDSLLRLLNGQGFMLDTMTDVRAVLEGADVAWPAIEGGSERVIQPALLGQVLRLFAAQERLRRIETERQSAQLRERLQGYRTDFEAVGQALMEEADNRGWCSDYDAFVDRVQSTLRHLELPVRMNEYMVTWTETYLVTVERTMSGIEARDEDAAVYYVHDSYEADVDGHELIEAIRNGAYEHQESDDWSASVE